MDLFAALDALVTAPARSPEPGEIAIVTLYFGCLALLSVHGLHRASLLRLYLRSRRWRAPDAPMPPVPPFVTVQLPIYNERYVVEDLLEAVGRLDYPRDRWEIQVLDDSTDETQTVARAAARRLAAEGLAIEYLHRDRRDGYKAGALAAGLARARGELIAIFDADFRPAPDFLRRTVPFFADPRVGCVQARWSYANRERSWLTRAQAVLLDGHFVVEQTARSRNGLFFNFNGTAGVLRRSAIDDAGGWQTDTLTEDTDLSYRAQLRGWRFVYLPEVEAASELPVDIASFHAQQARWAKGLTQTGLKLLPAILRAPLPRRVKLEAALHFAANASHPLTALVAMSIAPAALARFETMPRWMHLLDVPVFAATLGSLAAYYWLASAAAGESAPRRAAAIVAALAAGIGLVFGNARACLEALAGVETPFARTAKYSGDTARAAEARQRYGSRAIGAACAHLAAGLALTAGAARLADAGAWASLPFVVLFAGGFLWAGALAVAQALPPRLPKAPTHRAAGSARRLNPPELGA